MRAIVPSPLVVVLLAAAAPYALASDIHVPADYATVQGAINAAADGDSVLVDPGTYFENIDFKGKAIIVAGTGGADVTTIDGGSADSVVRFVNRETANSVIDGFTLTHGMASEGGGIRCDHSSPGIKNCRILENQGVNGGGLVSENSANPTILNCDISNNYATNLGWGGGIQCSHAGFTAVNTSICFNTADFEGGGIQHGDQAGGTLVNCIVWGNTCTNRGGGVFVWQSTILIWNTIIRANSSTQIYESNGGFASYKFSNVEGGTLGSGNIDADPLLSDVTNHDFHLLDGSPCVEAGSLSAPFLPAVDFYHGPRVIGATVDIGVSEPVPPPHVESVTPTVGHYGTLPSVSVSGWNFSVDSPVTVRFGDELASNVAVLDDATLTCSAPSGTPGFVDVGVGNSHGEGVLPLSFLFTPAVLIDGDATPGGAITIHYLCDPGDGIFAVYGLPPAVSVPTPPFDGDLAIVPFHYFFYVAAWPFDSFDLPATIPNDPALVGVDVLLQSLIGPQLTKPPKVGTWTNCAVISIH
jgi:hypothetical protein